MIFSKNFIRMLIFFWNSFIRKRIGISKRIHPTVLFRIPSRRLLELSLDYFSLEEFLWRFFQTFLKEGIYYPAIHLWISSKILWEFFQLILSIDNLRNLLWFRQEFLNRFFQKFSNSNIPEAFEEIVQGSSSENSKGNISEIIKGPGTGEIYDKVISDNVFVKEVLNLQERPEWLSRKIAWIIIQKISKQNPDGMRQNFQEQMNFMRYLWSYLVKNPWRNSRVTFQKNLCNNERFSPPSLFFDYNRGILKLLWNLSL